MAWASDGGCWNIVTLIPEFSSSLPSPLSILSSPLLPSYCRAPYCVKPMKTRRARISTNFLHPLALSARLALEAEHRRSGACCARILAPKSMAICCHTISKTWGSMARIQRIRTDLFGRCRTTEYHTFKLKFGISHDSTCSSTT